MKRNVLTFLFCMVAMFTVSSRSNAQSTLIHYWNFNSFDAAGTKYYFSAPGTVADVPADYTIISSPAPTFYYQPVSGTSSTYGGYYDSYLTVSTLDYDTVNLRMSDTAGLCFRARNPNDSSVILLYMPTTGFKDLVLNYGCEKSSDASGDSFNVFSYSVDSGTTWITSGSGLSEWQDSGTIVFRRITVNINDTNAYNNRKFVFRINFAGNTALTSGNNRFDNITLDGTLIPGDTTVVSHVGVNQIAVTPASYTLYPNPVKSNLYITSGLDGDKSVVVTNMVGEVVFTGTASGTHFTVPAAQLNGGIYFISIRENSNGALSTMKFIKE